MKLKLQHGNYKFVILQLIMSYNSRTIKIIITKFNLDLCIVVKNLFEINEQKPMMYNRNAPLPKVIGTIVGS